MAEEAEKEYWPDGSLKSYKPKKKDGSGDPSLKAAPDTKAKQATEPEDSPFVKARRLTESRAKAREAAEKATKGDTTNLQAKAVTDLESKRKKLQENP